MVTEYRERACWNGNYSSCSPFCDQNDWRANRFPLPPMLLFLKFIESYFEIPILIIKVETSSNHASRDDTTLQVQVEKVVNYEFWPVFTYSISYWEVNRHFWRSVFFCGWNFLWGGGYFPRGEFSVEKEVSKMNFQKELHTEDFIRILMQHFI